MAKNFPNESGLSQVLSPSAVLDDVSNLGSAARGKTVNKFFTGSRAIIKINGKLAGFAFASSFKINTSHTDIWTIDDWTPYELAPSRLTVEGTLSMFHIPGKGPSKELIQSNVLSFMMHRYITIEIRDRTTDSLIFKTNRAVIVSRQEDITAGQIVNISLQWKAIGFVDEMLPAFPDGLNTAQEPGGSTPLSAAADFIGGLF